MSVKKFERALDVVLIHEGGYVNHPDDPGGATNQGVTQRVYDDYRRSIKEPAQSVRLMTVPERNAIYRNKYWNLIKGDTMPPGVGYVVFDGAVNSGVKQSVLWLQRALGVSADGILGGQTETALNEHPDHDRLIAKIIELREKFLRALKTFKTFGKGWLARIAGVKKTGQAWAMGSVGPVITFIKDANQKAYILDAKTPPSTAPGDASAGAGGITLTLTQATDQLTPYANIEFIAKAVGVLTIVSAVVGVGGLVYRAWAAKRTRELAEALS